MAPVIAKDVGTEISVTYIVVSITALLSDTLLIIGGPVDQCSRVRMPLPRFVFSIAGSLFMRHATPILVLGRNLPGISGTFIIPASLALIEPC